MSLALRQRLTRRQDSKSSVCVLNGDGDFWGFYGSGEGSNSNSKYGELASGVRRISEGSGGTGGWTGGSTVEGQGAGKS